MGTVEMIEKAKGRAIELRASVSTYGLFLKPSQKEALLDAANLLDELAEKIEKTWGG